MSTPTHFRQLLASARTADALEQLSIWAQTQLPAYRQAALLLQASWASNEQQANQGLIASEEAERVRNRITAGALSLIDEIESGNSAPKGVLERLQKQFLNGQVQEVLQSGNFSDVSGSSIQVQGSQDVVIGSGNVITKKKIAGLARGQFLALVLGVLVLIIGGYYGLGALQSGQESAYISLQEIQKELKLRGNLDAGVAERPESNKVEIEKWLAEGMAALKNGDYATAVPYLEKVAEQAPLATVRQNLAYAYEQLGNANKARENMEAAKKINPNLDVSKSFAQLKGKRINLLASENGGGILASSGSHMERLVDGKEGTEIYSNGDFAVWGFKDKRTATFNQFSFLVPGSSRYQFVVVELSYGNDSPTGQFTPIGRFELENALLTETPFQEINFPAVTAKYFKLQLRERSPNGYAQEVRLMGEL
ncbi:MAG TPA: tetratricopeptide repeat protein [Saprospiraceae bacterium]|nr:tetratricopeptide repeat protein [Saprospiraceae bacterium]